MEDLKQMWQQYDEKLQRSQALNEQLLRRINTYRSADQIGKMRNVEYLGLVVLGGMLLVLLIKSGSLTAGPRMVQVSYALVLVQMLGWLAWGLRKLSFLRSLELRSLPVAEALRRIGRYRLMIMRERLWGGLSALFFFLIPAIILGDYWMGRGVPILEHPAPYALRLIPALVIGLLAGLWAYRKYYKDPIEEVTRNLEELEELKEEE